MPTSVASPVSRQCTCCFSSQCSAPVRKLVRYDRRFWKATWNRLYACHGAGTRHECRVSQRDVRRSCHRIDYSLRAAAVSARHSAPAIVTIILLCNQGPTWYIWVASVIIFHLRFLLFIMPFFHIAMLDFVLQVSKASIWLYNVSSRTVNNLFFSTLASKIGSRRICWFKTSVDFSLMVEEVCWLCCGS